MPKLTDQQRVILAAAAKRTDGVLFPLPKSLKLKGRALHATLGDLLKKDLLAERPAKPNATAWREDKNRRVTLVLSKAGLQSVGGDPQRKSLTGRSTAKLKMKRPRQPTDPMVAGVTTVLRPGSKQALLLDLLGRDNGATIAELVEATRWQLHSIRGAISGTLKKKLGLAMATEKSTRGRVYRIRQHA
jgi:hypothetical protein